jgi:NADH-quinone oxidoreductase subunit A
MSAMDASVSIVAYLALFAAVGILFLFVNLLVGRFLRPSNPHPEKLEIYECGEPSIGSSYVQFDLRFYVVALVFIVFDVEVAFLFPWATVFGKSHHLADERFEVVASNSGEGTLSLTPAATGLYREMGFEQAPAPVGADAVAATDNIRLGAQRFVVFAALAMGVFFSVLLIGFAYEWKSGAFDWVRAVTHERNTQENPQRMPLDPIMDDNLMSV